MRKCFREGEGLQLVINLSLFLTSSSNSSSLKVGVYSTVSPSDNFYYICLLIDYMHMIGKT